jgi:hypothetical protein
MLIALRNFASLVLLAQAATAFAQADTFKSSEAAIAAMFPNEKYIEWGSTEGDWNEDGIKDLAMILSGPGDNHRLVVLAGVFGGGYFPLSISSSYCDAPKFYNLDEKGASLFVTQVYNADENGSVSNTLKFRFNKKLADFELIGREDISRSHQDKSYDRLSVNYPAGLAIEYKRVRGHIKATKRSRFAAPQLARLNGFACDIEPY